MTADGHKETSGYEGGILFNCGGGGGSLVYIFVKTHQNVCLKLVNFIHGNDTSIKLILKRNKILCKKYRQEFWIAV